MADTKPKPFVFVLMPFADDFDDVYQLGIKPACENVGSYAERVDEQLFSGTITQRVYNQISKADVIVADMTGRNANVFYEVGYAHALGKSVVLMAQDAYDIPFDLKDYPHIIYRGKIAGLIPELETRVRWCIDHAGTSIPLTLPNIVFHFNGTPVSDNPVITYRKDHELTNGFGITFDATNSTEKIIQPEAFQLSIVTSDRFTQVTAYQKTHGGTPDIEYPSREAESLNVITLPDGGLLHAMHDSIELYPGGWASIRLFLSVSTSISEDAIEQMVLRINTHSAAREYPFQLQILLNQDTKSLAMETESA